MSVSNQRLADEMLKSSSGVLAVTQTNKNWKTTNNYLTIGAIVLTILSIVGPIVAAYCCGFEKTLEYANNHVWESYVPACALTTAGILTSILLTCRKSPYEELLSNECQANYQAHSCYRVENPKSDDPNLVYDEEQGIAALHGTEADIIYSESLPDGYESDTESSHFSSRTHVSSSPSRDVDESEPEYIIPSSQMSAPSPTVHIPTRVSSRVNTDSDYWAVNLAPYTYQ